MALPERSYYSLIEAAEKLECSLNDIYHFISDGYIDVTVKLDLEEHIKNKKVSINGQINIEHKLTKSNRYRCIEKYQTNQAIIKEKIFFSEKDKSIKRIPIKIKGLFSIRDKSFNNQNFFIEPSKFKVNKFYIGRLPILKKTSLDEYNPRVISLIGDGISFDTTDLLITRQELLLIKAGGVTINWRLNKGKKELSKMPNELKNRVLSITQAMDEDIVLPPTTLDFIDTHSVVGQKPHYLKEQLILIAKNTKNHYLTKGIDIGLKAIAIKIKNHENYSNKGLPSAEQIAKWFTSAGIKTSETTKRNDFELVIKD